jgi:hypothetical protein
MIRLQGLATYLAGVGRLSPSKKLYTALIGKLLCRATLCSCQVHERVFGINQALTVTTSLAREDPEPKRRREVSSGTFVYRPSRLIRRKHSPESAPCSHEHIRQVRHVVSSPGSPPDGRNKVVFGKRRSDLEVFSDDGWEEWEKWSHRQQVRASTQGKLMVTVFASNKRTAQSHPAKESRLEPSSLAEPHRTEATGETEQPGSPDTVPRENACPPEPSTSQSISHGTLFKQLPNSHSNQIRKIHQNLGHPDMRILQMALRRNGWSEQDIRGCADFVCPTCYEQQQPKLARPGKLKVPALLKGSLKHFPTPGSDGPPKA